MKMVKTLTMMMTLMLLCNACQKESGNSASSTDWKQFYTTVDAKNMCGLTGQTIYPMS